MAWILALVVVLSLSVLLFAPRSCNVEGNELKVQTSLLTFKFDLRQATEVRPVANDQLSLSFTLRIFAAGWPLKPFGWFHNSQFGTFLNLVDDPTKMYFVRLPRGKLLVSPHGGMKEITAA